MAESFHHNGLIISPFKRPFQVLYKKYCAGTREFSFCRSGTAFVIVFSSFGLEAASLEGHVGVVGVLGGHGPFLEGLGFGVIAQHIHLGVGVGAGQGPFAPVDAVAVGVAVVFIPLGVGSDGPGVVLLEILCGDAQETGQLLVHVAAGDLVGGADAHVLFVTVPCQAAGAVEEGAQGAVFLDIVLLGDEGGDLLGTGGELVRCRGAARCRSGRGGRGGGDAGVRAGVVEALADVPPHAPGDNGQEQGDDQGDDAHGSQDVGAADAQGFLGLRRIRLILGAGGLVLGILISVQWNTSFGFNVFLRLVKSDRQPGGQWAFGCPSAPLGCGVYYTT